jgi:hypothetical protein
MDQSQSSSSQQQSAINQKNQDRIAAHQAESPTLRHFELGQTIALMYIAAQGVDLAASDAACQAMENATPHCRLGFESIIKKSPYRITAMNPDQG